MTRRFASCACCLVFSLAAVAAEPLFEIGQHPLESNRLSELFRLHYREPVVRGAATLWDMWLPAATLWYAGENPEEGATLRNYWRSRLLTRPIDAEGYVGTCQHLGGAHADGWPFPIWTQAGGFGHHFTLAHNPYLQQLGIKPTTSIEGWKLDRCSSGGIDPQKGLTLTLDQPNASITLPPLDIPTIVSPFLCLDWSVEVSSPSDSPELVWTVANKSGQTVVHRRGFSFLPPGSGSKLMMVELAPYVEEGRIKEIRIEWNNSREGAVTLRAIHSAIDTRHNINNSSFLLGCMDYADWTGDLPFLRESLPRMWHALDFALDEFNVRQEGCVRMSWVGHDGRTGLARNEDESRKLLHGRGIGNNYWDLMPFGGRDALATTYLLHAIDRLADLHALIKSRPDLGLPMPPDRLSAGALRTIADRIRATSTALFWSDSTGRYGACVDDDNHLHDFGYTFLNFEAIHYGLATDEQARSILDWVDGRRLVSGDTSQGSDIYHFRMAPRATTKRNTEWYVFAWAAPESIPFGGQVQDGGCVLGFSYHDLMSRLKHQGPDAAWQRMSAIAQWFDEVQREGGYREYYKKPGRGSLQGCGPPGGIGIDCEFAETLLVPLVLVEGFAGIHPTIDGLRIEPKIPNACSTMTLHRVNVHGIDLAVTLSSDRIEIQRMSPVEKTISVAAPPDYRRIQEGARDSKDERETTWNTAVDERVIFERQR